LNVDAVLEWYEKVTLNPDVRNAADAGKNDPP